MLTIRKQTTDCKQPSTSDDLQQLIMYRWNLLLCMLLCIIFMYAIVY